VLLCEKLGRPRQLGGTITPPLEKKIKKKKIRIDFYICLLRFRGWSVWYPQVARPIFSQMHSLLAVKRNLLQCGKQMVANPQLTNRQKPRGCTV